MSIKDMTSTDSGSSKTYAGSQLQIQAYVNSRSDEIDAAIRREFPELVGAAFQWRSPLAREQYREYWDRAFLAVVDQERHWPALRQFWPKGGPHWDALAVVVRDGRAPGVLLVEAKSYVDELLKGAAIGKTVARASRQQIELAMAWTQGTVGVCGRTAAAWCDTPLYQSANRLAHLQWFNCRGVDAWLVHVLFTGDAYTKPATADEWKLAVREVDRQLGIEGKPARRAGYVTLPAASGQQRVHDGGAPLGSSDVGGFGTPSRLGRAGQRRRDAATAAPGRVESDRIRGCLLGGAVGDALGAPVEFDSIDRIRKRFGPDGVTEFAEAYGRPGAITDDTQMTLFTAEGLIRAYVRQVNKGMCDTTGVVDHAYARWLATQGERSRRWTEEAPDGLLIAVRGLHDRRAPGNTCISALQGPRAGSIEEPLNDSKGCGGVMRIAPVGLLGPQYSGDRFDLGCEVAALTHGHPSGYLASGALAAILAGILQEHSLDTALDEAERLLLERPRHEETLEALRAARTLAAAGGDAGAETIATLGGGWVAEEALAISVYCALVAESFEHGVRLAVNHSGDSDSTGAITGNILGLLLGADTIPSRWIEHLELREEIEQLIADWLACFGAEPTADVESETWWQRYPGW